MNKALCVAVWLWAGACAAQLTKYPGALDDAVNLPPRAPNDTITSQETNTQNQAIKALEVAVGTDAQAGGISLAIKSVLQRLAEKASLTDLVNLNPKILAGALNASQYTGGDVGARVNAAIADCDAQVGSGQQCRVFLPPVPWVQTTSIKISRSHTELDCGGGWIIPSNSFTDVPIRVNIPTVGTLASTWLDDISIRNCAVFGTLQTSLATQLPSPPGTITDSRYGSVVVWRVHDVVLDNLQMITPLGSGLEIYESRGMVTNISVTGARAPYAGGKGGGIFLKGEGYTASSSPAYSGKPIVASGLNISDVDTYGIHAQVGAKVSNFSVRQAGNSCVGIGGGDPQGWVSIRDFDVEDCAQSATAKTGSIDDLPAAAFATVKVQFVDISNGIIRRSRSDGVVLGRALSCAGAKCYDHTSVTDVTVECWGSAFTGAAGITLLLGGTDHVARGNHVSHPSTCPAQLGSGRGIDIAGVSNQIIVDNNTISNGTYGVVVSVVTGPVSNIAIRNNFIQGTTNTPIWLNLSGAGTNTDLDISGNHFATVCTDGTTCGMIMLTVPATTALNGLAIANNVAHMDLGTTEYGIETNVDSSHGTIEHIMVADNLFYNGINTDHTVVHLGINADKYLQQGVRTSNDLVGGPGAWTRLQKAATGTGSLQGVVICLNADGTVNQCDTAGAARQVIGIGVNNMGDSEYGYVQTSGTARSVRCNNVGGSGGGGSIAAGDLLVRSTSTSGNVMGATAPGVGEVVGKALTTCVTVLDMVVTLR